MEVLQDPEIDAVSIASYDQYHTEQIIAGLRSGKHLFVEKPLCHVTEEAYEIVTELKKNISLRISTNLILRKSPRFIQLREMIANGELGSISNIKGAYNYGRLHKITSGWRSEMDYYSGVCGGGIHILDLMQWLLCSKISHVTAIGNQFHSQNTNFTENDLVNAILNFENGSVGCFTSDLGCVYPHFHVLEAYGTKGTFINQPGKALHFSERNNPLPHFIDTKYPGINKGDLIFNFIESIFDSSKSEITLEDIFSSLAVCLAIDKSVKSGKTQKVQPLI